MVANAAKLCGLDTGISENEANDLLALFSDNGQSALWARSALAFCYKNDILSRENETLTAERTLKRCEIAEMIYRMPNKAELLL